ncbi:MAG: hypothetical protein LBO09_02970 [Candidatus Peribacteria bacterium]|jgi:tRNA G18 (ribose-2'-O)-methylase SpoU|nr:hypothetical protein [Candidatus Peribacteria bacterium]
MQVIAAEITEKAEVLGRFQSTSEDIAVIFGNEVDGVLETTLQSVDAVVAIPMNGTKESLNIGQSAAIFMWELKK